MRRRSMSDCRASGGSAFTSRRRIAASARRADPPSAAARRKVFVPIASIRVSTLRRVRATIWSIVALETSKSIRWFGSTRRSTNNSTPVTDCKRSDRGPKRQIVATRRNGSWHSTWSPVLHCLSRGIGAATCRGNQRDQGTQLCQPAKHFFARNFRAGAMPKVITLRTNIADPTWWTRFHESATCPDAKIASETQRILLAVRAAISSRPADFFVVLPAIVITLKP